MRSAHQIYFVVITNIYFSTKCIGGSAMCLRTLKAIRWCCFTERNDQGKAEKVCVKENLKKSRLTFYTSVMATAS
jgi:hypothetical protein